jgi:hypothetical protein
MIEKDIRRLINLVEEKSEDQIPKQLNESTGVTDYNPKSVGGTRKELLAKYHKTNDPKDAEAARKAGATQKELKQSIEEGENIGGERYDKIADLKGRTVDQLNKLIQKFEGIVANYPDHTQASEYLGLAKMIRAEKIGKKGVAEGLDSDTQRLEQEVRDALNNGDDYTAKQLVKMASTPEAKKYLLKIIKQEMYGTGPGQGGVMEGTETKWEVTYSVEIKSYDERPSEDRDYDETVAAPSKEEAIAKVKKTAKRGAYNFTARQIKQDMAEGLDPDKRSGKSATEKSDTMESKSLIAQGINKILKR